MKFTDFDQNSQKEMLARKERILDTMDKRITVLRDRIEEELEDLVYWTNNLCKTEEEKKELIKKSNTLISEFYSKIHKLENTKTEIENTQPHELKLIY